MHDIGFFADIQYADILHLVWLVTDTNIYRDFNCRDQVSSVVNFLLSIHTLTVLVHRLRLL